MLHSTTTGLAGSLTKVVGLYLVAQTWGYFYVIHAQAGIQGFEPDALWIPAFAGKTPVIGKNSQTLDPNAGAYLEKMLEIFYGAVQSTRMLKNRMHTIDQIPVEIPQGEVRRQLHMKKDKRWDAVKDLVQSVRPFIKPQALYRICFIDEKQSPSITIQGVRFNSKILVKNLMDLERVFPYVVTIGKEFGERLDAEGDMLKKFCIDVIGNVALGATRRYLEKHLQKRYGLTGISFMSPGSLTDWPVDQQRPLFALFGEGETPIGVALNDSCLMIPAKSVSGIYFPTEVHFSSCQLCDRENCPGRKAAYDAKVARSFE